VRDPNGKRERLRSTGGAALRACFFNLSNALRSTLFKE